MKLVISSGFRFISISFAFVLGLIALSANATMNIELRLAADGMALSDGAAVSSWTDNSGLGRNATQAAVSLQPVFKTGILNGLPVVRFTGQGTQTPSEVDSLVVDFLATVPQPFTIFVVANMLGDMPEPAAGDYFCDSAVNGGRVIAGLGISGLNQDSHLGMFAYSGVNGGVVEGNVRSAWDQGWRIYEFYFNGASSAIYTNGALLVNGSTAASSIFSSTDLRIGANWNNDLPLNGDMAEFRIYSGTPTFAERNIVGDALALKYGLATAYVPPGNQSPTVSFSSPTNNSVLQLGPQTVTVSANDVDGTVTNVAFYINGGLVGQLTSGPYTFVWRTSDTGTYELVARAWDNDGASRSATSTVQRVSSLTVGASADALIYATTPNSGYPFLNRLECGPRWGVERVLMKFDISAIPDMSPMTLRVDSIQLQLRTSMVLGSGRDASNSTLEFRQVTNAWDDNLTWMDRKAATPWATAGGDFDSPILGTFDWSGLPASAVIVDASDIPFTVDILPGDANKAARKALISAWMSGSNFGFHCKNNSEVEVGNQINITMRSMENVPGPGPVLLISYTVESAGQGTVFSIR